MAECHQTIQLLLEALVFDAPQRGQAIALLTPSEALVRRLGAIQHLRGAGRHLAQLDSVALFVGGIHQPRQAFALLIESELGDIAHAHLAAGPEVVKQKVGAGRLVGRRCGAGISARRSRGCGRGRAWSRIRGAAMQRQYRGCLARESESPDFLELHFLAGGQFHERHLHRDLLLGLLLRFRFLGGRRGVKRDPA